MGAGGSVKSNAIAKSRRTKLLVAAIDFGTTFSGWAYSFGHQFETSPTNVFAKNWNNGSNISNKAPTAILIKPGGEEVEAFGYKAEDRYMKLSQSNQHHDYYFFQRFKLMLNNHKNLTRDTLLEDEGGKRLPALKVFSLAIECIQHDLLDECTDRIRTDRLTVDDVDWVITVPAIWNSAARQFMHEAGAKAGIPPGKLQIVLEPEAASVFCQHCAVEKKTDDSGITVNNFLPGTKYLVVDAGGGTVDVAVHEVMQNGHLKELYRASGGPWGGTKVDVEFNRFLIGIFGSSLMDIFKEQHMDDYLEMFRAFEVKKREVAPENTDSCRFTLPATLIELFNEEAGLTLKEAIEKSYYSNDVSAIKGNKIDIESSLMKSFFQPTLDSIANHLKDLFKLPTVKDTRFMLLVGGFSESKLLKAHIETSFHRRRVLVAPEASLVVLKGAVIIGHCPSSVEERVASRTYGIMTSLNFIEGFHPENNAYYNTQGDKKCRHGFDKLVEIGEPLKIGERRKMGSYSCPRTDESTMHFDVYESLLKNPMTTDDRRTTKLGSLSVNLSEASMALPREQRTFEVSVLFGRTQIEVEAREISIGTTKKVAFDAL